MRIYLLIIAVLSLHTGLHAQVRLNTTKAVYGPNVTPVDLTYLLPGIEQVLTKYAANANFYDAAQKTISEDKMTAFTELFTTDAQVCPDYLLEVTIGDQQIVGFVNYMQDVYERLGSTGIPFTLSGVQLEKVDYDPLDKVFRSEITFIKKMQLGLSPAAEVIRYKNGRSMTQRMVLTAEKSALTHALIVKIVLLSAENVSEPAVVATPVEKKDAPVALVTPPETTTQTQPAPPVKHVKSDPQPTIVLNISSANIDPQLPASLRAASIAALQKALNDYNKFGSLFDPASGKVTETRIDSFVALFNDQSRVYNDLLENEPEYPVNLQDYISMVFTNLGNSGVKFKVETASLESIKQEFEGFYKASILINKSMLHYLGDDKTLGLREIAVAPNNPVKHGLRIWYSFTTGSVPKIDGIESSEIVCPRAREDKLVSVSGRFGFSLLQPVLSDQWLSRFSADQLTVTATNTFSGGIRFSSNTFHKDKKCKKPLFWMLGASYYQTSMTTEIKDWKYTYEVEAQKFSKEPAIGRATQVNNLKVIEGELGGRYRLKAGFKTTAFIDFSVLPSYLVSGTYAFEDNPTIFYDGIYNLGKDGSGQERTRRISDLNAFNLTGQDTARLGVGTRYLTTRKDASLKSTFGLTARLGFSIYKKIGYNWGVQAGLDFSYAVLSPVSFQDSPEVPYKTPADIGGQGSLLQDYVKTTGQHTVGLRLGVYYRIDK